MLIEHSRKPEGTFNAFAAKLGISPDTLYEWASKHPEFSESKKVAKAKNEAAMLEIGLKGMKGKTAYGWQSAWIFAMKARHGWREEGPEDQDESDLEFDLE